MVNGMGKFSHPPQAEVWFSYSVRVQPRDTDYAGVVWHGNYLAWLEAARIDCLRQVGVEFVDLVAMDCDLPVVKLVVNYHRAVTMGSLVMVKSRLVAIERIRLLWQQRVYDPAGQSCYLSAELELVPVNRTLGKVLRRFPPSLHNALQDLTR
jgi:acyl-CoA thioester hydrolase